MTLDLERVLAVAEDAAREAGALLLQRFGKLDPSRIRSKSYARDLVTEADVESERALVARLRKEFPDHAIEAEEETRDGAGPGPRWFLDPLDGTINFVHGLPHFAVSMGLFDGARGLVGVVHAPRLGETFTAREGGGAFVDGRPIRVSSTDALGDAILATGFPYGRNELEHDNLANFGRFFYDVRGLRRTGSAALDLAFTAAGRYDGYWELHLSPHDMASGAVIVREAGGRVGDPDGGEGWLRSGHVVAAGPGLFDAIAERVRYR